MCTRHRRRTQVEADRPTCWILLKTVLSLMMRLWISRCLIELFAKLRFTIAASCVAVNTGPLFPLPPSGCIHCCSSCSILNDYQQSELEFSHVLLVKSECLDDRGNGKVGLDSLSSFSLGANPWLITHSTNVARFHQPAVSSSSSCSPATHSSSSSYPHNPSTSTIRVWFVLSIFKWQSKIKKWKRNWPFCFSFLI